MKGKIKIIESEHYPTLEKSVNQFLDKGWKIKGNMIKGSGSLIIMLYKKSKV